MVRTSSSCYNFTKEIGGVLVVDEEGFIMSIDKKEITKEMLAKAMQCKTAEEVMAYAKSEGVDITAE